MMSRTEPSKLDLDVGWDSFTTILTCNLPTLKQRVAKLNRKAKKLGLPLIRLDVIETRTVQQRHNGRRIPVSVTDVSLQGETPKLEGWALGCVVEHTPEGNLLYIIEQTGYSFSEFRNSRPVCDHCKTNRRRNDTFVLIHDDGSLMQVGKSCVKDFLGHGSLGKLTFFQEATRCLDEFEGMGWSPVWTAFGLEEYLAWVVAAINQHGWIPRSKDDPERGVQATADMAVQMCKRFLNGSDQIIPPTLEDLEYAKKAIALVLDRAAKPNVSDYIHNIAVIARRETVTDRQLGLAASIVAFYRRELERQAEKENSATRPSRFIGRLKERITVKCTALREVSLEGHYGVTWIYGFITPEGDVITWFASSKQKVEIGQTIQLTGTVKDHKVYREEKQTVLTRCRIKSCE